jgi:carbon storage regulator
MSNLILSRRAGESVKIGDSIIVTVVGIAANQVRLAFSAPPEVLILREELLPASPLPPVLHVPRR